MYGNSGLYIDSDSESVSQDPAERVENFSGKISQVSDGQDLVLLASA